MAGDSTNRDLAKSANNFRAIQIAVAALRTLPSRREE
jgi:hypothetical protein